MPSILYDEIRSKVYGKASMYDFLDLTELQADEFVRSWIRSAYAKPYIRKLFSTITVDDEVEEITYEMKYVLDEAYDREFVIEVFAYGVLVEWLNPKINNVTNIAMFLGSSDEKAFSQASHLKELRELRDSTIREQRNFISDRGYSWNTYLDGDQ